MGDLRQGLTRTGLRAGLSRRRGGRRRTTLPELRQQVSELEALQQLTGAPEIEQDEPGFFRRLIDVFSGFNYATAGFADELLQGNSIGAATSRATRELLSSARSLPFAKLVIPEVEAEKEAFGQVLEQAGVGTYSLGDLVPALEGTILGEWINTRGTAGLVLDIATDPLTYLTFGTGGAARRLLLKAGQVRLSKGLLSKGGDKLFRQELKAVRSELAQGRSILEVGSDVLDEGTIANLSRSVSRGRAIGGREFAGDIAEEMTEEVLRETAYRRAVAKHGEDVILDEGGIKWLGRPVVKGKTLQAITSKFGAPVVAAVRQFKFGDELITSSEKFYQGLRDTITGIFHQNERLAKLPESQRMFAIASARRFRRGQHLLEGRLRNRVENSGWFKFLDGNPEKNEEIVRAVENGTTASLGREEQAVAAGMTEFFDELGRDAVELGIITEQQFASRTGNYFAHFWENAPEEFTEVWNQWQGKLAQVSGKHNAHRTYNTLDEGVRISGLLEQVTTAARNAGIRIPKTPQLIPNYIINDVMGRYVRWYSKQKSRRLFAQEMSDMFGIDLEKLTADKLAKIFDGLEPEALAPEVLTKITARVEDAERSPITAKRTTPTEEIIELNAERGFRRDVGEPVGPPALDEDMIQVRDSLVRRSDFGELGEKSAPKPLGDSERAFILGLEKGGRREYLRQVLRKMNSQSQVVDFLGKYGDEFADSMPVLRADLTGVRETALEKFGETASEYVLRGGNAMWGKDAKFVPRLIANYIDEADPKIFQSRDWPALQSALTKIDWTNNWFKIGVYPFFPASGVRDLYSNIWFNSFRIGFHALNPRLWAQSIKVLAHNSDAPATIRAMEKMMRGLGYNPDTITTRSGRVISTEAAARQLRARNVMLSGEELVEIDQATGRFFVRRPGESRFGPKGLARGVLKEVREPLDNTSRVALAVQDLIDDLSFDDAAEEVGRFLFHYNEIPAFSREIIARFIPFARFSLKNIEFHYNMMRRNPGAVINRLKPFRGRENERGEMVRFKADALQIRLDRDGRTLRAVTGVDLPTRNLDLLWRGNINRTLRMGAGMLGPIFKMPLEVATGVDVFTGTDRKRIDSSIGRFLDMTDAPTSIKNWVGYKKTVDDAGRSRYTVDRQNLAIQFLRGFMFSRIISTTDRQFREYAKDEGVASMFLDVMTGLRRENINLDEQQMRLEFRRRRELREVLARRGVVPEFEIIGKPDFEGLQ